MTKKKEENIKNEQPAPPSVRDLLIQSGKIGRSIEQTIAVIIIQHTDQDPVRLKNRLMTEGTEEYITYHLGLTAGNADIEYGLFLAAAAGDADALKALKEMEKEKAVGKAIGEKFFPSDE